MGGAGGQNGGIHLRRDTWVSVMYAEGLNSAKSSVILQSTDRHGILGEKSADFQVPLCSWQAERTPHGPTDGLSKSSGHRLQHAMERRHRHPESWWWETEDGRQWLTRLVVATLYTFGLKRGVGLDTMSEFCTRLHLATQVGGSHPPCVG